MITNDFVFLDFETTGVNPYRCQPIQLAAVVVDGRRFTVVEGSEFQALIRPEFDLEKCKELGLDPLTEDSIRIHGKTREILECEATPQVVWKSFVEYVKRYNPRGTKWTSPILAGYNVNKYDIHILNRLSAHAPYKFGPIADDGISCGLFHPRDSYDVIDDVRRWTHTNQAVRSLSMDTMRDYLGMSKENAHDAMTDVMQGAMLLCKFLNLYKTMSMKVNFKDSCRSLI